MHRREEEAAASTAAANREDAKAPSHDRLRAGDGKRIRVAFQ